MNLTQAQAAALAHAHTHAAHAQAEAVEHSTAALRPTPGPWDRTCSCGLTYQPLTIADGHCPRCQARRAEHPPHIPDEAQEDHGRACRHSSQLLLAASRLAVSIKNEAEATMDAIDSARETCHSAINEALYEMREEIKGLTSEAEEEAEETAATLADALVAASKARKALAHCLHAIERGGPAPGGPRIRLIQEVEESIEGLDGLA